MGLLSGKFNYNRGSIQSRGLGVGAWGLGRKLRSAMRALPEPHGLAPQSLIPNPRFSDFHNHFPQALAREEELHGFVTREQLFQAAVVEQLRRAAAAGLRHLQRVDLLDAEGVVRHGLLLVVGVKEREQVALGA